MATKRPTAAAETTQIFAEPAESRPTGARRPLPPKAASAAKKKPQKPNAGGPLSPKANGVAAAKPQKSPAAAKKRSPSPSPSPPASTTDNSPTHTDTVSSPDLANGKELPNGKAAIAAATNPWFGAQRRDELNSGDDNTTTATTTTSPESAAEVAEWPSLAIATAEANSVAAAATAVPPARTPSTQSAKRAPPHEHTNGMRRENRKPTKTPHGRRALAAQPDADQLDDAAQQRSAAKPANWKKLEIDIHYADRDAAEPQALRRGGGVGAAKPPLSARFGRQRTSSGKSSHSLSGGGQRRVQQRGRHNGGGGVGSGESTTNLSAENSSSGCGSSTHSQKENHHKHSNSVSNDDEYEEQDYWYFDNTSNGFYYQHSGTQGWKRSRVSMVKNSVQNRGQQRDYWQDNKRQGDAANTGVSNSQNSSQNQQNRGADQKPNKPYYPRGGYQPRNQQNHQNGQPNNRGPLPDWDEVAERAASAEAFDYMEMLENQYQHYYTMISFPAFDPMKAATAGSYMIPIMPNGWQFRAPVTMPAGLPPMALNTSSVPHPQLQAAASAAQAAMDKQTRYNKPAQMNGKVTGPVSPTVQPTQVNATQPASSSRTPQSSNAQTDSRPESVASSLNSHAQQTPAAMMSPTGNGPMPMSPVVTLPANLAGMPVVTAAPPMAPLRGLPLQSPPIGPFFAPFPVYTAPVSPPMTEIRSDEVKDLLSKQIEYYFSVDNLQKDFFLRRKMDKEGYVPLNLICAFPRVSMLSNNMQIRTRINPESWPMSDQQMPDTGAAHSGATVASTIPESNYVVEEITKASTLNSTPPTTTAAAVARAKKPVAKESVPARVVPSSPITPSESASSSSPSTHANSPQVSKTVVEKPVSTKALPKKHEEVVSNGQPAPERTAQEEENWHEVKRKVNKKVRSRQDHYQRGFRRNQHPRGDYGDNNGPPRRRYDKQNGRNGDHHNAHADKSKDKSASNDETVENGKCEDETWQQDGQVEKPLGEVNATDPSSESSSNSGDAKHSPTTSVWTRKAMERAAASTPQSPKREKEGNRAAP